LQSVHQNLGEFIRLTLLVPPQLFQTRSQYRILKKKIRSPQQGKPFQCHWGDRAKFSRHKNLYMLYLQKPVNINNQVLVVIAEDVMGRGER